MQMMVRLFYSVIIFLVANYVTLSERISMTIILPVSTIFFLIMNIVPSVSNLSLNSKRLRICANGCELLKLFLISTSLCLIYLLLGICGCLPLPSVTQSPYKWLFNVFIIIVIENIVFWNGIIRVYMTSEQLGIRYRVLGILCGMIPIAHLLALGKILQIVSKEVIVENEKILLNQSRKNERICATKYPILMVHGVFFRDFRYFNYWGRIPKQLEENGATIFYGNQQSAESVETCAAELKKCILQIIQETGCEKVNIIAHSKGGLDSRYAISMLDVAPYVASLTTINTPHYGCEFADYLLDKMSDKQKNAIAKTYNATLSKLGDPNPDFLKAVSDLTASACRKRNEYIKDVPDVYYQSVGSKLNIASSGRFPLNFSHHLVKAFDGTNDGLVGEKSFIWGEHFEMLTVQGIRGISHGDMIDLNRENFDGFDVREYFVQLVADLKRRGF